MHQKAPACACACRAAAQANIDRGVEDAGFAIPKRMWADALGPEQLNVLHECLEVKHPMRVGMHIV
jgi:hypothetical protein